MTQPKEKKQTEKELAQNTVENIKIAKNRNPWRELLTRKSIFGGSDFMIYTTDRKYEIVRYHKATDSVDTVLTGVYWDCDNDDERFAFIIEDFESLFNALKEDWATRDRPDTELEADQKERERLLKYQ